MLIRIHGGCRLSTGAECCCRPVHPPSFALNPAAFSSTHYPNSSPPPLRAGPGLPQLAQFYEYRDKNYGAANKLYTWLCADRDHPVSCLSQGIMELSGRATGDPGTSGCPFPSTLASCIPRPGPARPGLVSPLWQHPLARLCRSVRAFAAVAVGGGRRAAGSRVWA